MGEVDVLGWGKKIWLWHRLKFDCGFNASGVYYLIVKGCNGIHAWW